MVKRTVFHVTKNPKGGWDVKKQAAKRASTNQPTKTLAITKGRQLAKNEKPGQLVIHKQNGQIQTEHTYGNDPHPPKG
jgi:hypothetical protein